MGPVNYYQILKVSHTATRNEIKASYRALALQLHPDVHKGCSKKQHDFQLVNQAYQVLSNVQQRRVYDQSQSIVLGNDNEDDASDRNSSTASRKRYRPGVNANYRKVYAPRPPPDWEFTFNHKEHYDMHYGNGLERAAALRTARAEGTFEYKSPLGRGFSFCRESKSTSDINASGSKTADNTDNININPFSKYSPQGPTFDHEQGNKTDLSGSTNKRGPHGTRLLRRDRIVQDMLQRRSLRHEQAATVEAPVVHPNYHRFQQQQQQQQQGGYPNHNQKFNDTFVGAKRQHEQRRNESSLSDHQEHDCIIL
jgi:curved DNA-binding protein CbpA